MKLEFVSYDGSYPNLCSWELVMRLNDELITFPSHCMVSGGNVSFDNWNEYIDYGEWSICKYPDKFPDELKVLAVKLVNENVELGCCGGCI